MTKEQLIEKKAFYTSKLNEISSMTYEKEIEEELAQERKKIEEKYAQKKAQDVGKVTHYVELLDELIVEAIQSEAATESENSTLYRATEA